MRLIVLLIPHGRKNLIINRLAHAYGDTEQQPQGAGMLSANTPHSVCGPEKTQINNHGD